VDCPFHLSALGYKLDLSDEMGEGRRFVHPDGHPYYPIELPHDGCYSLDDCIRLMVDAAYKAACMTERFVTRFETPKPVPNCQLGEAYIKPRTCSVCGPGPCAYDHTRK